MKIQSILKVCFCFCAVFIANFRIVVADAFLQKRGDGIFIPSFWFQSMNSLENGKFIDSKKVYQEMLNLYAEYGLTNRITIGAKVIAIASNIAKVKNFGLGKVGTTDFALDTTQLFTRIGIIRRSDIIALSFVGAIWLPSYHKYREINYFSISRWSYEAKIELGLNITKNNFMTATLGWHSYINHTFDEIRAELLYGFWFLPNSLLFMLRFQEIFYVKKATRSTTYGSGIEGRSVYDFALPAKFAKLTLSVATPVGKNTMLEVGAFTSIKSKYLLTENSQINLTGGYIGFWYNF